MIPIFLNANIDKEIAKRAVYSVLLRLFLCLCGAFFASAHDTDFIAVFIHILGALCLVGVLALDPAEAGGIDHILRAALGDFRLWDWLWFGRISWLQHWLSLIFYRRYWGGSGQLFISFLQDWLGYRSMFFLHLGCQWRC